MKTKNILTLVTFVTLMLFASCEKESINPAQPSGSNTNLRVKMTDSPGNYAALDVSIVSVQAYLDEMGWITLNNKAQQVSVIKLCNGLTTDLSFNTNVNAGLYTKIKLVFADPSVLTVNAVGSAGGATTSTKFNLTWVGPKEIEIPIYEEISVGGSGEVILDFNVASSVKEQFGQYVITPVIKELKDMTTGIRGTIEAGAHAAIVVSSGLFESSTYADASGKFVLYSLEPGTYTMRIFSTAEQIANGAPREVTIQNVVVSEGKINEMGTLSVK